MTRAGRLGALCVTAALLACATAPSPDDASTQDVLEVVAVLRLHVDDDTYRFPPARDISGLNVYRASFERLESAETAHADKLATGYLTDVVWFAKARALERIGEYKLAAMHYARVAELDSELAEPARVGRSVCQRLLAAVTPVPSADDGPQQVVDLYSARRQSLGALRKEVGPEHWRFPIEEEIERGDAEEASYFAARALADTRLEATALQRAQQLVELHKESKNRNRHLLALADLYAALSRRYAERFPPSSLGFETATFDEYAHDAARVYEVVAQQDGTVEKLEAAHKLEAYLSYTLQVHEDKLPH